MWENAPQSHPEDEPVIITDLDPPRQPSSLYLPGILGRLARLHRAPALSGWSRACLGVLLGLLAAAVLFQPPLFHTSTTSTTTYSALTTIQIIAEGNSQPAILDMSINNGFVYMITSDGAISAYRGSDGLLAWEQNVPGGTLISVIATSQAIYCLQMKGVYGRVVALYPSSGLIAWEQKFAIVAATDMSWNDGIIFLHTSRGVLYAVNSGDGHTMWSAPMLANLPPGNFVDAEDGYVTFQSSPSSLEVRRESDGKLIYRYARSSLLSQSSLYPLIQSGIIYSSSEANSVEARSANDGSLLWRYSSPTQNEWYPVIQDGIVLVRNSSNALLALRGQDGKPLWKYATNAPNFYPAISNETVYMLLPGNQVVALRESDGALLWHANLPPVSASGTSPDNFLYPSEIVNGIIYVNLYFPGLTVYALRESDGTLLWHHVLQDTELTPLMAGGVIILHRDDFTIEAYSGFDGQLLWSFHSPQPVLWSPDFENNSLFVQTSEQSLIVLRLSDGKRLWQYGISG